MAGPGSRSLTVSAGLDALQPSGRIYGSSGKFRKSMPTVSVAQSNSPASPRLIPIELPLPMIRSASADTLIPKKSGSAELPRTEPVAKVVSHSSTFSDSTLIEVPRVPAQSSVTGAHEAATRRWDGGFRNPWPSAQGSTIKDLLNKPFERSRAFSESVRAQAILVKKPRFWTSLDGPGTHSTWLGHASVLVQFAIAGKSRPINVLFDPVFSARVSPFSFVGPKRFLPAPCTVDDLPHIDYVCISHNHYDHLDRATIARLVARPGGEHTRFFLPLGNEQPLLTAGVRAERLHSMDWWDEVMLPDAHVGTEMVGVDDDDGRERQKLSRDSASPSSYIRITCTPAQHGSSRRLVDWNKSLWSSWVVEHIADSDEKHGSTSLDISKLFTAGKTGETRMRQAVYFGGDTGYRAGPDGPVCPAFAEIGAHFGGFDLAFIPIWRGGCLSFLSRLGLRLKPTAFTRKCHATPEDALAMHMDLKSKLSVPIHFGTFVNRDEMLWSVEMLNEACEQADVPLRRCTEDWTVSREETRSSSAFALLDIGRGVSIESPSP